MIPLAIPNLDGNESKYLQECISTNFVSSVGPFVTRFEKMIAEKSGTSYAVTTSSGTTALHLALLAVGVKPNDLVIVPSFSFIATANAVSHCGATPWLMDIEASSWTLNAAQVASELRTATQIKGSDVIHKATGRRVAAILPVHVLGNPADLDPLIEVAKEFRLPLVCDGAAALGALYRDRAIGDFPVLTTYSFNGNKTITCGGGGAVAGQDKKIIEHIRHISSTARVGSAYHHDQVGFNYRMTNIQAAVGCGQMERLESFVRRKQQIDACYRQAFLPDVFPRPAWGKSACWFSGVVLKDAEAVEMMAKALLDRDQIESRPFWKPIHLQPPYKTALKSSLDLTESIWSKILTLPCSTSITDTELSKVTEAVRGLISVRAA